MMGRNFGKILTLLSMLLYSYYPEQYMSVSFHKNEITIQISINTGQEFVKKESEERAKAMSLDHL